MSTILERTYWELRSFCNDEQKIELEKLFNAIKEHNIQTKNLRAFIPVGRIDEISTNIGELEPFIDYEINTYVKIDEEGNEFESYEEYEEHIREEANDLFENYEIVYDEDGFEILDEDGYSQAQGDGGEREAKVALEDLKNEWIEEKLEEWDDLDIEYDEVYWNIVWQYNGYINEDLARKLGFGILTILSGEYSGEQFMFLRGCGMDLSPKHCAYQALEFGYIDEDFISKLATPERRDYFRYVVGKDIYKEVLKSLQIDLNK